MALLESPSPVLLEAVLKVDQVVLRLQNLQNTISGIQLSPVNPKHTRVSRATATTRALSSKDCSSSKENIGYSSRSREDCRRKSFNYNNADQSLKSRDWKQWSSPATQVHDVISEILVASEFAKQIATLVAEALGPQVKQVEPEPLKKKTPPRDGKRRDIAFPSKAQVQKTMSAKAPPSKAVNKFKLAYNDSSAAKVTPPVRISRSDSRRMFSSLDQKLFSSPSESFRDDNDADDELAGSPSTKVTEIKSLKPWKLTPTKGVLFSNPVYLETTTLSPPPPPPAPRIVPTTGRRRSWLTHQFPKKRCSPKRKVVSPPSRYVEMVPLDGPRDNSLVSTLDVLKGGARRQETRASRSQSKANSKQAASVASPDKENAPLPSCAPSATKFLRSMSSGQTLHRSSSRKNPGASLLQRAKGWMSSQVARQGKGREVPER